MPSGRIPGPYGEGDIHGLVRYQLMSMFEDLDKELKKLRGPVGVLSAEDDENELRLLQEVYGVIRANGKTYFYRDKNGKWLDDVDTYVEDRNKFFGQSTAYKDYKKQAFEELEADSGKLRKLIEPNENTRKVKKDWKEAQTVFYCWIRKAYQNQLGDTADIPKLIKSGMSEKLQKALKQVRIDYGNQFQSGGFNPRPMKLNGKYRLGTLSDHALGTAIDIESEKNAQIDAIIWEHILGFTGKSLNYAVRISKWKSAPEDLHKELKEVNDEFVKRLAKAISDAAAKTTTDKTADGKTKTVKTDPLEAAIDQDKELKKIHSKDRNFLRRWKNGFLSLEWKLVKELREEGFTWGATFSNLDLHHFEL